MVAVTTAIALHGWANAQTAPVSSSPSVSLQETKGLIDWQVTQDGREFRNLTKQEVKKLSDTDYDAYQGWKKLELSKKIVAASGLADKEAAKVITEENRLKENSAKVIEKYQEYIGLFQYYHTLQWKPGFNQKIYDTAKLYLKQTIIAGKPPEIIRQLEPLRLIIMS